MEFFRPRRESEAQLVADFYWEMRKRGIECHLEYKIPRCRFDAVIVKESKIILIIEFKRDQLNPERTQIYKYPSLNLGVPILLVIGREAMLDAVHLIQRFVNAEIVLEPYRKIYRPSAPQQNKGQQAISLKD